MGVKVNFVLDDDVKAELDQLVESGMRSGVINEALRKELLHIKRQKLAQAHDEIRAKTRRVSTQAIVNSLRRDRGRS